MVLEGIPNMAKLNTCPMHRIPNTLLGGDAHKQRWGPGMDQDPHGPGRPRGLVKPRLPR